MRRVGRGWGGGGDVEAGVKGMKPRGEDPNVCGSYVSV